MTRRLAFEVQHGVTNDPAHFSVRHSGSASSSRRHAVGLLHSGRLLAALTLLLVALPPVVGAATADAHTWEWIEYPPIPVPGLETEKLIVQLQSGGGEEATHLRFDVLWSARRDAPLPSGIADASKFMVRLHLSDGEVVPPNADRRPLSWLGAGSRGMTYSLIYTFPWQRNAMDEAWIELVLSDQSYWIEMPYGFTRNPADALPSDAQRGNPTFPPTMADLGKTDRLVPWLYVHYDLGKIQNNWRLALKVSNALDAQAEAILYREDSQVGKSMFLWRLDTPVTAMEIRNDNGYRVEAHAMGIRLHQDGMRRSDDYAFNRYPDEGRGWGRMAIKVDDQTYRCSVPSSLFKYVHGVTDPGNAKRLPRPRPLLGP